MASRRELTSDQRHRARKQGRFRVILGPSSSFTVDVSAGGFSTEPARALRQGEDVQGIMQVNGDDLAFGGEVVWVKRSAEAGPRARMGVRFTRVPFDLQKLLDSPGTG